MTLTKYKLGELIERKSDRNTDLTYGLDSVRGINTEKILTPTRADLTKRDLSTFRIIKPNEFLFSRRLHQSEFSRLNVTYNNTSEVIICTEDNVVFGIARTDLLLTEYLFMYFNRSEFDRYVSFNSWGSSVRFFNWEDMCEITFPLPPIHIQRKYVNIYKAMLANQRAYERGLEDLKLVCDGYIEDLRRKMQCERIGAYIYECNERNDALKVERVQGVNSNSSFDETKANMSGIDIGKYKIVRKNQFAYNPSRINIGSIALLSEDVDVNSAIVSPMYTVFAINDQDKLLPEYLMLWFNRKEFHRSTLFYASGSVRDTFGFDDMCNVSIPLPDISIQRSIANIYNVYTTRKRINEKLKAQIKSICPILIKGAVEEAQSEAN